MWRPACAKLDKSVHPVLVKAGSKGLNSWEVIGSAFCINQKYNPTFITNAHVVVDDDGNQIPDENLALLALAPGGAIAGFSVMLLSKELDVAVCEASRRRPPARHGGSMLGSHMLRTSVALLAFLAC